MASLPVLSGREVIKAFTLRSLIRSSGLTVDEFVALSRK